MNPTCSPRRLESIMPRRLNTAKNLQISSPTGAEHRHGQAPGHGEPGDANGAKPMGNSRLLMTSRKVLSIPAMSMASTLTTIGLQLEHL